MHPKKQDKITDQFIAKWREEPVEKRAERVKELMIASKIGRLSKKQELEAQVLGQIAQVKGELEVNEKEQE